MKQRFKRLCSLLLSAALVVTSVPGMETTAYASQVSEETVVEETAAEETVVEEITATETTTTETTTTEETTAEDATTAETETAENKMTETMLQVTEEASESVNGENEEILNEEILNEEVLNEEVTGPVLEEETVDSVKEDVIEEEDTPSWDFVVNVNGTEEEQADVLSKVKIQSIDGTQDLGFSVPIESYENFSFHIEIPEGYIITSLSQGKGYKMKIQRDYANNNFTIIQVYNSYDNPNVGIRVNIDKIQDRELYIEYPDTIESLEVLCDGTPVELVNGIALVSNASEVVLNVKPEENQLITAKYESENDTEPASYSESSISEDGTYCYEIGRVVYNTNIVFSTASAATVAFDVDEGISGSFYSLDNDYYLSNDLNVRVKTGTRFNIYFYLNSDKLNDNNFVIKNIFADGTEEELEYTYDMDNDEYLCKYTVTQNATLSFKWVPKTLCKVTFDSECLKVFRAEYDGEYYVRNEYEEGAEEDIYAGNSIYFAVKMDKAYKFEYVSPTGESEDALEKVSSYYDGEYTYYIYKYQPQADTVMQVKAAAKELYNVSIDFKDAIAYYAGYEESEDYYYYYDDVEFGTEPVLEGDSVLFTVAFHHSYKLEYVSTTEDGENQLKKIGTISGEDAYVYYVYKFTPTEDTTIYAKAVPKEQYTLSFNLPEDVYIYSYSLDSSNDEGGYYEYEGNYSFWVKTDEDDIKIETVTAVGSSGNTIALKRGFDNEERDFYYTVPLTENITVTVTASQKQEYDVELSSENVEITDVTGIIGNEDGVYTVRENDVIAFNVTPDTGYTIESVVMGSGDDAKVLYPVVKDGIYSYAAKINSDTQINITTVSKTSYKVSFINENNNAVIACENATDDNGNYIAYANEPVIFTVTANEGYVIDEVTGTDDLQLMYNPNTMKNYYQFIPEEDTTVTVSAKAAQENEISFTYEGYYEVDDTLVWYENGDSLTVTEGKVSVSSDKIVWFDLAEYSSKVVSVKCTDESGEARTIYRTKYNGCEGFCIGNVTEDMQITIYPGSLNYFNLYSDNYWANEKFIPVGGRGELPTRVYVPYGESFEFQAVPKTGYKLKNVTVKGDAAISGSSDTGIYCITPNTSNFVDLNVHASSVYLENSVLRFDYPSADVALKVYVRDEEYSLTNNSLVLPSTEKVTLKVKPLTDKLISLNISVDPESIEADGTRVYVLEDLSNYSYDPIIISAKEYYTVDFLAENISLMVGQYNSDDGEWKWKNADNPIKVVKGAKLKFRINADSGYLLKGISLEDEGTAILDKKTVYDEFDEYIEYEYYEITPSANVTINADMEAIEYNTYNFVYDPEQVDLFIGTIYENYDDGFYADWEAYTSEFKKESFNTQKVLFKLRTKAGYKVSSVKTDRENPDVTKGYDEYGVEDFYYYLFNTEDTTITINTEEINYYDFTFKKDAGIESITIFDPDSWDEYYVGENGINLSNEHGYYIVPNTYYDDALEVHTYRIVSVKANGEELKLKTWGEAEGSGYWLSPDFSEDVEIVIETARNENLVNTTEIQINSDKDICKLFYNDEYENDEGEVVTSKIYLNSGEKRYTYGRTAKYGVEVEEGYIISKVEFERNGKVQALTADEEGLYSIYYPLSRGLKGTLTVYTEEKNKPVETYTALPLSLVNEDGTLTEAVPENGVYSSDSGLKYAASVEGSINGKAVITKAEITAENGQAVSSVSIGEDKKQAEISIAKEDEGKLLYVNLYAGEKSELVATYIIIVNKPNLIESVTIDGITDGIAFQAADTIKAYKLNIKTAETELPKIGVEVIPAEGYSDGVVKAELKDGSIELTIAAICATEKVATVRLYEETEYNRLYIQGGTFPVYVMSPLVFINKDIKAEISKCYDVALNLSVYASNDLNELVTGKYYYKVEVTPLGTDIPEEIIRATAKPQYFEKEPYNYQEINVVVNDKDFGEGRAWKYNISVSIVQTNGKDITEDEQNILYESKKTQLTNVETLEPHFTEKITFYKMKRQLYTGQSAIAVAQYALDTGTSYPDIEKAEDITELDGKGSALHVYLDDDLIFVNVPNDAMIGKHTIELTVGGPASMGKTKGTYEIDVVKAIENLQLTVPSVSVYKPSNKAVTIKPVLTINQGTTAPKSKNVTWEAVKANGEAFVQGDALYRKLTIKNGTVSVDKNFVPSATEDDNQFRIRVTAVDHGSNSVNCISDVITLTNQPAEIGMVCMLAPAEGGYQTVVKEGSVITTDKLKNAFVAVLKKGAEEKDFYTEDELKSLMLSKDMLTYKSSNKAVSVQNADEVKLSATKAAKNVKLTVSTNDGGKKKAVMKFTVAYATPEALALEVSENNVTAGAAGTKDVTFAGTTNTRLTVKVKEKTGESWADLKALANYKLSIKNGKIVSSDNANGVYEIIVISKTATVTLDNKTSGKASKDVYSITNTAYSEVKAPKVKTSEKLLSGKTKGRSITYELSGTYNYKNKVVFVETDYVSRSSKTALYEQFEAASDNINTLIPISTEGKFALNFNENNIQTGSYKLKLTFGYDTNADDFIAETKPVTLTLKAVKPKVKKGSYKPVTSYKIEAKAGAEVKLSGKGKNVIDNSLDFYELKNANINGKPNNFINYFELKDGSLCLKSNLTDMDISYLKSAEGKNELTGYVSYKVSYGDNGYGKPYEVDNTVKLTIKLK